MGRPLTDRLVRRVRLRLALAGAGHRFCFGFGVAAAAYLLLLAGARLLALGPDVFTPATTLVVPGLAAIAALVLAPRPTRVEAARRIDAQAQTRDLFLTAVLSAAATEAFTTLVLDQAEARAGTIRPAAVVRFRWQTRAGAMVLILALLLGAGLFLPQLDPFGKQAQRQRAAARRQWLVESGRATSERADALRAARHPGARLAAEIERDLDELMRTFNEMKPDAKEANLRQLAEAQAALGQLWRQLSEERLQQALNRAGPEPSFGGGDAQKIQALMNQLDRGDASGLTRELNELKQMAEQAAAQTDPLARQQQTQALQQRLKALKSAVANRVRSSALAAALDRALEQVALGAADALADEALAAAAESLDLAGLEALNLAQVQRDLERLDQALRALQLARQLNLVEGLDGKQCSGCEGLADYAALYARLLAECRGTGAGMQGPGTGTGGKAPQDDAQATAFQPEAATSALTAGKLLLEWKTRDVSTPGRTAEDYRERLREVRQSASEAILQEQVPPGYHDAIRNYFDSLGGKRQDD